jgi:hypothetical protein
VAERSRLDSWIVFACLVFIGVLALSGAIEHDVLTLHILQSLIYFTVIGLSLRHSKWGYAIGISISLIWDFYNLFTGFVFRAGFRQWSLLLHGRPATNLVQLSAPVAWLDHILLIVLLIAAYTRLPDKRWSDILRAIAAFAGTLFYFAGIIALTWPQFIPRFRAHFGLD